MRNRLQTITRISIILGLGVLFSSVLYAVLTVRGISENISLLIAFLTLVGILVTLPLIYYLSFLLKQSQSGTYGAASRRKFLSGVGAISAITLITQPFLDKPALLNDELALPKASNLPPRLAIAIAQAQAAQEAAIAEARVARQVQMFSMASQERTRAYALQELATALAQAQEWREAERVARSIEGDRIRASALVKLASALAQAGEREQAQPLWHEAGRVARSIEFDKDRASALWELATALAQAQEWHEAERVILSLLAHSSPPPTKKPSSTPPIWDQFANDLKSPEIDIYYLIGNTITVITALIGVYKVLSRKQNKTSSQQQQQMMEQMTELRQEVADRLASLDGQLHDLTGKREQVAEETREMLTRSDEEQQQLLQQVRDSLTESLSDLGKSLHQELAGQQEQYQRRLEEVGASYNQELQQTRQDLSALVAETEQTLSDQIGQSRTTLRQALEVVRQTSAEETEQVRKNVAGLEERLARVVEAHEELAATLIKFLESVQSNDRPPEEGLPKEPNGHSPSEEEKSKETNHHERM